MGTERKTASRVTAAAAENIKGEVYGAQSASPCAQRSGTTNNSLIVVVHCSSCSNTVL